jgi:hypothetical protein
LGHHASSEEAVMAGETDGSRTEHSTPAAEAILSDLAARLGIDSAVVVLPSGPSGDLAVSASVGLPDPALNGLMAAMRDPGHPIARTFRDPVATWDVPPTRPGGPALRSHVALTNERGGAHSVVGVLALAYEEPLEAEARHDIERAATRIAETMDPTGNASAR